ncbi:MAG TPA: hypothetical protein P5526_18445 [Anaerolineae bacterium]|nr:hypothetical protein [Anaerolineae bacterium]MCB0179777.1 hypothetical protein [Anaerolineae bacterium]MCB0225386.1 hypothetical protein [Anaerolineae bacterium]MCB9102833.1 hypothetical protein [Anaerolineales bacterium]HRV94146.1 hypothetical protein [Anaerolineae bacterium]
MTTVGGKFTKEKRNLVTYIEHREYELLRKLAQQNGRSVSAEAASVLLQYLEDHQEDLKEPIP